MTNKWCLSCNEQKPMSAFYGKRAPCKSCVALQNKKEYYSDIEQTKMIDKIRYDSDNETIARAKKFMRQYEV